jgi:Sucrase/ferredoxin-like
MTQGPASPCSAASLAVAEPLFATATEGASWLLVEVRGGWGRDALADTDLGLRAREALEGFPGKVVLVRRPGRRHGVTLVRATAGEQGGSAAAQQLDALDDLAHADLDAGAPLAGPLVLVCAHGRRDACCARLGPPLFEALAQHLPPQRLWQSSHLGGHRFAPNVLVLPDGIQLGRIPPERAGAVAAALEAGRIPLDLYRGRTIYTRRVQAAEILARTVTGCDRVDGLRLLADDGDLVAFATPAGEVVARVEERPGPAVPVSCGSAPEPTTIFAARLESAP